MPNFRQILPYALAAGGVLSSALDPRSTQATVRTWMAAQNQMQQMQQFQQQMKMQKQELDLRKRYYDIMEREAGKTPATEKLFQMRQDVSAALVSYAPELSKMKSHGEAMTFLAEKTKAFPNVIAEQLEAVRGEGKTLLQWTGKSFRQIDASQGKVVGEYAFDMTGFDPKDPIQVGRFDEFLKTLPPDAQKIGRAWFAEDVGADPEEVFTRQIMAEFQERGLSGMLQSRMERYGTGPEEAGMILQMELGKAGFPLEVLRPPAGAPTTVENLITARDSLIKQINQTYEDYGIKIDIMEFAYMDPAAQKEYLKTIGTERAKRVPEPLRGQLKTWISELHDTTNQIVGLTKGKPVTPEAPKQTTEQILQKLESEMPATQNPGMRVPHKPTGKWFWSDGESWHLEE